VLVCGRVVRVKRGQADGRGCGAPTHPPTGLSQRLCVPLPCEAVKPGTRQLLLQPSQRHAQHAGVCWPACMCAAGRGDSGGGCAHPSQLQGGHPSTWQLNGAPGRPADIL
jgi:hypothetical protein